MLASTADCIASLKYLQFKFDREIRYPDPEHIGRKGDNAPRVHTVRLSLFCEAGIDHFKQQGDADRKSEMAEVESVLATDPLYKLNARDKELVRKYKVCLHT